MAAMALALKKVTCNENLPFFVQFLPVFNLMTFSAIMDSWMAVILRNKKWLPWLYHLI